LEEACSTFEFKLQKKIAMGRIELPPVDYETTALPLSYIAFIKIRKGFLIHKSIFESKNRKKKV
jgi:hypothetical protein